MEEEGEGQKRKAEANGSVSRASHKRARENDKVEEEPTTTVTEEEVEEFFAILRRIHVAVKYFKGKAESPERARDFEANGVKEEEHEEENVGFDLNADPGTD